MIQGWSEPSGRAEPPLCTEQPDFHCSLINYFLNSVHTGNSHTPGEFSNVRSFMLTMGRRCRLGLDKKTGTPKPVLADPPNQHSVSDTPSCSFPSTTPVCYPISITIKCKNGHSSPFNTKEVQGRRHNRFPSFYWPP